MRPFPRHRLAGLALLLTFSPCPGADVVPPAKAPAPAAPEVSLDQFIANAKRSALEGPAELKAVVAQLDPLREKRKALLATRRARETELARLQAAGGDAKRIAALRTEIDACRSQLNIIDTQFQVLIFRIQALQNPGKAAGGLVPGSKTPPAIAGPMPAQFTRTVPPDKIKAAVNGLSQGPAPSATAARTAATQILDASQPGYTSADVDQLARLILQLAAQDNATGLRAELETVQQANASKPAKPDSNEIKLVLPSDPKPAGSGGPNRLLELQARQARLEQALIELSRKPATPSNDKAPQKPK